MAKKNEVSETFKEENQVQPEAEPKVASVIVSGTFVIDGKTFIEGSRVDVPQSYLKAYRGRIKAAEIE